MFLCRPLRSRKYKSLKNVEMQKNSIFWRQFGYSQHWNINKETKKRHYVDNLYLSHRLLKNNFESSWPWIGYRKIWMPWPYYFKACPPSFYIIFTQKRNWFNCFTYIGICLTQSCVMVTVCRKKISLS